MSNKLFIVLSIMLVLAILCFVIFYIYMAINTKETRKLEQEIYNGALADLGIKKEDVKQYSVYVTDIAGLAILELDGNLYVVSYNYNKEGNLFVDVEKEI